MSEFTANLALVERAEDKAVIEGANFRKPGVVHKYRKPSLWARIVRFFN